MPRSFDTGRFTLLIPDTDFDIKESLYFVTKGHMMKKEEKSSVYTNGLWKFLISVRLTVMVLLTLAATSIIGTLIPQNESPAAYMQAYGEVLYRILHTLDIFDMYHSWWFQLLLVMLTINIVACSVDRLSSLWQVIFNRNPTFRLTTFRGLSEKKQFADTRPAETLIHEYEPVIARAFGFTRTEKTDEGFCIFAERGRWTRLGVYIVHLSVICLLLGGLIGSFFGFEGFANIPEGESVRTIRLRDGSGTRDLDFAIRCDDFDVSFYDSGAPKEYRSKLTIVKDGQDLYRKDIVVNDPLRFEGINLFQSSYGMVPLDMSVVRADGVELSFTSKDSGMTYSRKAVMGKPVDLPEGGGIFMLKDFLPSYTFMGQRDLGATLLAIVTPPEGEASEVRLPLRFPRFDRMRKDSRFVINVEGYSQRYYTGLQVTRDPGVPLVYAGFLLMIFGCIVTFFMSHQRICVDVTATGTGSNVTISGTANRNKVGMGFQLEKIARSLVRPA